MPSVEINYRVDYALLLLLGYLGVGAYDCFLWVSQKEDRLVPFFEVFYTMLIFVDILLVLISLQFSSTYHVAFRASGFAVATVFLRIALVAPPYINSVLGVGATLYALGLTLAYSYFFTDAGTGAGHDQSYRTTVPGFRERNAPPSQDETPEALPSR